MSSSEPERSRRLGAALEERGLAWLDAPVSGGVKKEGRREYLETKAIVGYGA